MVSWQMDSMPYDLQIARQRAMLVARRTGGTRYVTRTAIFVATSVTASLPAPARRPVTNAPATPTWSTQRPASSSVRSWSILLPKACIHLNASLLPGLNKLSLFLLVPMFNNLSGHVYLGKYIHIYYRCTGMFYQSHIQYNYQPWYHFGSS